MVTGPTLILLTAGAIALILVLILAVKRHPFLALVVSAMALGLSTGMAPDKVLKSIQAGFGEALGFIAVVVGLGAMIGRYLEYSGGGRALADWLLLKLGKDRAAWAMLIAAFLVGLRIFFEVGFIILAPLVSNLAKETKRSLLFYGLPMTAALTVTHSLVPPHPAPAAASQLLGGDLARTILYGILVSIPMVVAAGMIYGQWIAKRIHIPVPEIASAAMEKGSEGPPPAIPTVVLLLVLPVLLIFGSTVVTMSGRPFKGPAVFLGHPFTALAVTVIASLIFFGTRRGLTRAQ